MSIRIFMVETNNRICINDMQQSRLHLSFPDIGRSSGHMSQSSQVILTRYSFNFSMVIVIVVITMTIFVIFVVIVDNISLFSDMAFSCIGYVEGIKVEGLSCCFFCLASCHTLKFTLAFFTCINIA